MITNSLGMKLSYKVTDPRSIRVFHSMPSRVSSLNPRETYAYTNVVYIKMTTPVIITCNLHGDFLQSLASHLAGARCPRCAKCYRYTTQSWIIEAKSRHNMKYTYEHTVYTNTISKVSITCPVHGVFTQRANAHLGGQGCPKCGGTLQSSLDEWLVKVRAVHGHRYDYSKSIYVKALEKLTITCKVHGDFQQTPAHHGTGRGCPKCAKELSVHDTYKNRKTTLYYVEILHPVTRCKVWKIGITLLSVVNRFKVELGAGYEVRVLDSLTYKDGMRAYIREQLILSQFTKYRIYDNKYNVFLPHKGNTELFDKNVLGSSLKIK